MPRCQVVYDNRLQLIAKVACARALKLHLFLVDSTKTELSPLCVACRRARRLYNRKKREKNREITVMAFQVVQIAIEVRYHSLFTHRAEGVIKWTAQHNAVVLCDCWHDTPQTICRLVDRFISARQQFLLCEGVLRFFFCFFIDSSLVII